MESTKLGQAGQTPNLGLASLFTEKRIFGPEGEHLLMVNISLNQFRFHIVLTNCSFSYCERQGLTSQH